MSEPLTTLRPSLAGKTDTMVEQCGDTIGIITLRRGRHEARRLGQYLGTYDTQLRAVAAIEKAEDLAGIDAALPADKLAMHFPVGRVLKQPA
jgi:hypothetical protein